MGATGDDDIRPLPAWLVPTRVVGRYEGIGGVAGLGDVGLVAVPVQVIALGGPPGVGVISDAP